MSYIAGRGHTHWGPGTSMVQFVPRGFAGISNPDVCESQDGLMTCCDSCAQDGSCGRGLVGPGLGCACNKPRGMGLFDGGFDPTSWGWQEWFAIGIGGYVLTSMFFTGRRAARQVRAGVSKRVRRTRRRIGSRIAGQEL